MIRESNYDPYDRTLVAAVGCGSAGHQLFNESYLFKENAARWLYTGITRAEKRVTVII